MAYFSVLWICFSSMGLPVSQKVELTAKKLSCIESFFFFFLHSLLRGNCLITFSVAYMHISFHFESVFVIQSYNPPYTDFLFHLFQHRVVCNVLLPVSFLILLFSPILTGLLTFYLLQYLFVAVFHFGFVSSSPLNMNKNMLE